MCILGKSICAIFYLEFSESTVCIYEYTAFIDIFSCSLWYSLILSLNRSSRVQLGSPVLSADHSSQGYSLIDASKLNFALKPKRKELPFFRGDNTDKRSLCEWEGLMRGYLDKCSYRGKERVDELVSRLMGRARDIIRIWLRSNIQVANSGDVNVVFCTIRKHFDSTVCSGMPLTNFFSTAPYVDEQPLDYWIRLNRAAEVTEQALVNEGERMQLQTVEIAAMFIRHCPNRALLLIFLSKPLGE